MEVGCPETHPWGWNDVLKFRALECCLKCVPQKVLCSALSCLNVVNHRKKPLRGSLGGQGREVAWFQHLLSLQEGGWAHTRTTKDLSELPESSFSASPLVSPLTEK